MSGEAWRSHLTDEETAIVRDCEWRLIHAYKLEANATFVLNPIKRRAQGRARRALKAPAND